MGLLMDGNVLEAFPVISGFTELKSKPRFNQITLTHLRAEFDYKYKGGSPPKER